jgi:hypothetical protein
MPVALNGRVPVKVSSISENILAGDYITTSGESGKAMKAVKAGYVIGKALESWNKGSGSSTVMVFVEQGYYNGQSLSEFTGLDLTTNTSESNGKQILSQLLSYKQNMTAEDALSDIFVDRIAAGIEIITPKVITEG